MSNEDRIKGWRARRKDSSYAVGAGVSAWRLDPAALFEAQAKPAVLLKPLLAACRASRMTRWRRDGRVRGGAG